MQAVLHQSETSLSHKLRSLEERHAAGFNSVSKQQTHGVSGYSVDQLSRAPWRSASLLLQSRLASAEQRAEVAHQRALNNKGRHNEDEDDTPPLDGSRPGNTPGSAGSSGRSKWKPNQSCGQQKNESQSLPWSVTVWHSCCDALESESNAMSSELLPLAPKMDAQLRADEQPGNTTKSPRR